MNSEKARTIIRAVEGCDLEDGLSTIGLALIHLCSFYDIEKQHMLDAMSRQWDLYQKQAREHEQRDEHKAKMN